MPTVGIRDLALLVLATASATARAVPQRDASWSNNVFLPDGGATGQAGNVAFDPNTSSLILHRDSGHTLSWNGTTATQVARGVPSRRFAAIATVDLPGLRGLVLFGGQSLLAPYPVFNDSFFFDGRSWSMLLTTDAPSPRRNASIATVAGTPFLFGGELAAGTAIGDLYTLVMQGGAPTWRRFILLPGPPVPAPRSGAAFCPDGAGGALLFGGQDGGNLFDDTWRFDPVASSAWTRLWMNVSPPAGAGPMSFDPVHDEIIHVDPASGSTWRFPVGSGRWEVLPSSTLPLIAAFGGAVTGGVQSMQFDPVRREHVFVDATRDVSVFGAIEARTANVQPASCPAALALALVPLLGRQPRLGDTYAITVTGATPAGAVLLVVGDGPLRPPVPIPGTGCLAFFANFAATFGGIADGAGSIAYFPAIPNDPAFIGFDAEHQALDLATLSASHDLLVEIGR